MAKVPKDIQDGIKKLGEKTKVPVPDLLKRLKEIISTDESVQAMEKDDFKIRFAWAMLYKEYSMSGNAQECHFQPLLHSNPRDITVKGSATTVCDVTALVQKIERDEEGNPTLGEWEYGSGTFWREGAKNLQSLEPGKVYKTSVIMKENNWGYNLNSDRAVFLPTDEKATDFGEFFEKEIKPRIESMLIMDADLNQGEDTTDLRVLEVTIMASDVDERDGREFGFYDVYDDSIAGETRRFFLDPRDIIWEQGSMVQAGINVTLWKQKDGTEAHRINPQWFLPIPNRAEKKTLELKAATPDGDAIDTSSTDESGEADNEEENFEI